VGHSYALDIRTPIGGLFAILGVLLIVFGLITPSAAKTAIAGNIDLWWGFVMLAFGALMFFAARRGRRPAAPLPATLSPEGSIIEGIEHRSGLERE
jgi:uncharacterized protein DUF6131